MIAMSENTRNTIDVLFEQQGISVQELIARSGLSAERVLSILNGRWLPSPKERQAIAAAMGLAREDIDWGHTINPRNVRYHRYGLERDFS